MTQFSLTPATAPPPGETADFTGPSMLWKWNVLCQTACLSITGVMFFLRVYIRSWMKRVWILEDYLCCFSFAGLVVYSALVTAVIAKDGGKHAWDVTRPQLLTTLYYGNITQLVYGPAAAFTKSAILLLYIRVFSPRRWSKFDIALRSMIAVICSFYFAITIAKICQCQPRARIWDKTVPGKCVNLAALLDTSGLFNVISDVVILLVPLKGVWHLQMNKLRKIGIYAIFTMGLVAPVFSIIGFIVRFQKLSNPDQSYYQPMISMWAEAELATGVIIVCLPTLPSILRHRKGKPSRAIVNGSAKDRSMKSYPRHGLVSTDEDNTLVGLNYYELKEGNITEGQLGHISEPPNALVHGINDGTEDGNLGHAAGFKRDVDIPHGGIMKTVRISQSNV